MGLVVRTISGTKAGIRDPWVGKAPDWECDCVEEYDEVWAEGMDEEIRFASEFKVNPGYMVNCPNCWARRPK
jgi:hypothetical protein